MDSSAEHTKTYIITTDAELVSQQIQKLSGQFVVVWIKDCWNRMKKNIFFQQICPNHAELFTFLFLFFLFCSTNSINQSRTLKKCVINDYKLNRTISIRHIQFFFGWSGLCLATDRRTQRKWTIFFVWLCFAWVWRASLLMWTLNVMQI